MSLFTPTLKDMIDCADREVEMRKRVYARRVAEGKMSQAKADFEIECMQAIKDTLVYQALKSLDVG